MHTVQSTRHSYRDFLSEETKEKALLIPLQLNYIRSGHPLLPVD